MEGLWDHETQPGSCLPVRAIFAAVVDPTAHLLKSFEWWRECWRTIKNVKRAAVLCKTPFCEAWGMLLSTRRSLGDLTASGSCSGISRWQWGTLPAAAVLRVLGSSICSSSICSSNSEGRYREGCVCTSGTELLLLPELSVWSPLCGWIQIFLWLFLHTSAAYIILRASLIPLELCLTGLRICH